MHELVFTILAISVIFGIIISCPPSASAAGSTISIDSPTYVIGDTVTITGSMTLANNDNLFSMEILNPQGQSRLWQISSDDNGNFQTTYPLTEKAWVNGGTFKILVLQQNNVVASTNFVLLASNNVAIPKTMSDITKQWLLGKISDTELLENIQFIINNHSLVIPIPTTSSHTEPPIDSKFHDGAVAWIAQRSDDVSFAKNLSYLFNTGYLPVQITTDFKPYGSITAYPHPSTSNTNVLFFIPAGTSQYDVGQIVHFRGQVLSKIGGVNTGIPNAPYEIVDADTTDILTQGSTNNDGTFEFDWSAQSSGKSLRDLKAVFPGQGDLQMSESNTEKITIAGVITSPNTVTPSITTSPPTTPKTPTSNSPNIPIPSENVVSSQLIPQNIGNVRIISGTGDFSDLSSNNKITRVHTGSQISGTIQLSITSNLSSNRNIPLIMAYSWGPHQTSWQTIQNSIQKGTSEYTVNVNMQTPQVGSYFLIFAFSGDSSGDYIASSTSDAVGQPSWNNGHDLVDLQSPQIAQAQQFGHTLHQEFTLNGYQPKDLAADAVMVNVIEAAPPIVSPAGISQQQSSSTQNSGVQDISSLLPAVFLFAIIGIIVLIIRKRRSRRKLPPIPNPPPNKIQSTNPGPASNIYTPPPARPISTTTFTSNPTNTKTTPAQTYNPGTISSQPTFSQLPSDIEYETAIKFISKFTKNSELKNASPVKGKNGLVRATGNFGGVYEISINGKFYALKYFTKPSNDRESRYTKIARHIKTNIIKNNLNFLIDFQYLPNVIMVNGSSYPLVKMDWVRGLSLGGYLKKYHTNKNLLFQLAEKFLDCVIKMQDSNMAHGDLSDGNVMITKEQPNVEIKLVDYDGIFIPDFAGSLGPEDGRANFQHPARRGGKFYSKELDNFSALVIYLTIYAIAEDPGLEQFYDEGLFIKDDFLRPGQSPMIKKLLNSKSNKVKALTNLLLEALKHDPSWDGISAPKIKKIL